MGMAASQCSLLFMTNRKNSVNRRLGELTLQKRALASDAKRISLEFNDASNQKIYKWTNGTSYQDLTYTSLMKPNTLTKNKNYLITDLNDKVVLDGTYAEYAEMFSPNGRAGATWGGETRLDILSKLTGVSKEKLEAQENLQTDCYKAEVAKLEAENEKPNPQKYGQQHSSIKDLIDIHNNRSASNARIPIGEDKTVTITSGMKDILNLSQLGAYLGSKENQEAWNQALEDILLPYPESDSNEMFEKIGDNKFKVNWDGLLNNLIKTYQICGGEVTTGSGNAYNNSVEQIWFTPENYSEYKTALDEWSEKNKALEETLGKANSDLDALFDAETERLIKFYDTMFSAIAEKGWVLNGDINDPSYLNEMLQNNQYMITTVERNSEYDEYYDELQFKNEYDTTLTSQVPNIVFVNDADAREDALVKYEMEKYILNAKEKRIDEEMNNKKTELEALNQMIQSVMTIKNDNIENFNIFT